MRGRVVVAACAIAFVALLVLVTTGRPALDLDVATWIAAHRTDTGIAIARAFSLTGSVVSIVPFAVALAAVLAWRERAWHPVGWLALASAGSTALYLAVNLVVQSPRPPMPLRMTEELGYSFPSGHSTQAMAFWPMVALLVGTTPRVRRGLLAIAIPLVLAIGCSRIYLDVHWTTDVASGFALGLAWLLVVLALRQARAARDTAPP